MTDEAKRALDEFARENSKTQADFLARVNPVLKTLTDSKANYLDLKMAEARFYRDDAITPGSAQSLIDILRQQTKTLRLETATLEEYFPLLNEFAPIFQSQKEPCISALNPLVTTTTNADGKFEFYVPVGIYAVWTSDALHVGDAVLAWADVIEITDDHSVVLSEPNAHSSEPFRELVSEAPGKLSDGPFIKLDFSRLQQLRTLQARATTVGQYRRK